MEEYGSMSDMPNGEFNDEIDEDLEKDLDLMEKGYKTGVISGFFIATAVFIILILAFNYKLSKDRDFLQAKNIENSDEITKKVGLLEAYIDKYYMEDVDEETLIDGMYYGLVASVGDIYTTYYTKEDYQSLLEANSGKYCGIGVVIQQSSTGSDIIVKQVYNDSPADEVGILEGDIIYSVNGETIEGMSSSDLVELIVGKEDTKFKMAVKRGEEIKEFELVRRQIKKDIVTHSMKENNIGYIKIEEFGEETASDVKGAIEKLKSEGMEGLVIDLRDNPGGMLSSVKEVAGMFLEEDKLFLYSETKEGDREDFYTVGKTILPDMPISVLINENSASASEALSGAIKAYERGKIVGTTSFGKGIMQSIFPLKDGSAIKITVGKYYLPDGSNIHEIGIKPDYEVEDDKETEVDEQLEKAMEILN